jgi:hypothetical protein
MVAGVEQNADVNTLDRDGSHLRNLTNTLNLFESAPDWGSKPR